MSQPRRPFNNRISRRGLLGGSAGIAGLLLASCSNGSPSGGSGGEGYLDGPIADTFEIDGDLNLLAWADYYEPSVLAAFEEEYDVKVNYTYYSSADEALAKVSSGQPIDLTMLGSQRIHAIARGGLLRRVDHSVIPHYDEVLPGFVVGPYNGSDQQANEETAQFVTAPYASGSVGTTWQSNEIQGMTGSFEDFWTHPEASGRIYIWDDMEFTISMFLRTAGIDPMQATQDDMSTVLEMMDELRPMLGGFTGMETTLVESGQAWLMPVYAGDLYNALNQMPEGEQENWQFQTNSEGAMFNVDCFVQPVAGEHPGTALAFVDWFLQPENMRKNAEYIGYPIPTVTGMETYEAMTADAPWLHLGNDVFEDPTQWLTPIPDENLNFWRSTWNSIKVS